MYKCTLVDSKVLWYGPSEYEITEQCDICLAVFDRKERGYCWPKTTKCIEIGKFNTHRIDYCKKHSDKEIVKFLKNYKRKNGILD